MKAIITCHKRPVNRFNKKYLTRLQKSILLFYYRLRLDGIEISDYSLEELAIRFKCHPNYLCSALRELEEYGYMGGESKGSNQKHRWITCEAFCMLEDEPLSQILTQSEPILYNNLSDPRSDQIKIIEEAQNCGQYDIEKELDNYLDKENVSPQEKKRIKKALKSAPIGPVRRESVIRRVIHAGKRSFIGNKLAYFLTALWNEIKSMKEFIRVVAKEKLSINEYNLEDIGEIGCFV